MTLSEPKFLTVEDQQKLMAWQGKWNEILRDGVLIEVHVSQWQAQTSLTPERLARLGVKIETGEAQSAARKVMRSGSIYLIPRDAMLKVQRPCAQAHSLLYRQAILTSFGWLLSARSYARWRPEHSKVEAEFRTQLDWLLANLFDGEKLAAQMEPEYRALFADAYDRLRRSNSVEGSRTEFIEETVRDIQADLPSLDAIRARFKMNTLFRYAPMIDEFASNLETAAKLRQQETGDADKERGLILKQIQAEVAAQVEERKNEVLESLAACEDRFYVAVFDTLREVQAGVAEKSALAGPTVTKLQSLVARVRSLDIFQDVRLGEKFVALEDLLERRAQAVKAKDPDRIPLEEVDKLLTDATSYVRQQILSLPTHRGVRTVYDLTGDDLDQPLPETRQVRTKVEDPEAEPMFDPTQIRRREVSAMETAVA